MTHTHDWIPVNSYLAECSVCGKLKTTSTTRTTRRTEFVPKEIKPPKVRPPKVKAIKKVRPPKEEALMPTSSGITVKEIKQRWSVCNGTIRSLYQRRLIYRIRNRLYDRKSVEAFFDNHFKNGYNMVQKQGIVGYKGTLGHKASHRSSSSILDVM